jgi:4-hydroxybenzoate polyprenyltransferase
LTDTDSRAFSDSAAVRATVPTTPGDPAILTVVHPATALLKAAHAAPTVAVTVLATTLSAAAGQAATEVVLVAAAVLTGQLSIGWSNDLIDQRRDRAAHRRDKPLVSGEVLVCCTTAAAACLPLSLASGWRAGVCQIVAVGGGWAYNLGLKRTLLSWLPYAVSFGLLTAFLALGLPGHPSPHAWLVLAGALLGVGAHFLNVVPDIEADRAAGVLGLPQRLGAVRSRTTGAALLAAAAATVTLGPAGDPPGWTLVGLVLAVLLALAAAVTGRATGSRLPFLLALATAAVTVLLLVARGADLGVPASEADSGAAALARTDLTSR